jgi:hypothetical protein
MEWLRDSQVFRETEPPMAEAAFLDAVESLAPLPPPTAHVLPRLASAVHARGQLSIFTLFRTPWHPELADVPRADLVTVHEGVLDRLMLDPAYTTVTVQVLAQGPDDPLPPRLADAVAALWMQAVEAAVNSPPMRLGQVTSVPQADLLAACRGVGDPTQWVGASCLHTALGLFGHLDALAAVCRIVDNETALSVQRSAVTAAAYAGHLDVVTAFDYALEHDAAARYRTARLAAVGGHMPVLTHLRERGLLDRRCVVDGAVQRGDAALVAWAATCPKTCRVAERLDCPRRLSGADGFAAAVRWVQGVRAV